jgi:hypothetical protein
MILLSLNFKLHDPEKFKYEAPSYTPGDRVTLTLR